MRCRLWGITEFWRGQGLAPAGISLSEFLKVGHKPMALWETVQFLRIRPTLKAQNAFSVSLGHICPSECHFAASGLGSVLPSYSNNVYQPSLSFSINLQFFLFFQILKFYMQLIIVLGNFTSLICLTPILFYFRFMICQYL